MNAPVLYIPDFLMPGFADHAFESLLAIDWVQRDDTPRMEYYCNDTPAPYTYGVREGQRTYLPQPTPLAVKTIRNALFVDYRVRHDFDVCFLNRYDDPRKALGWHADDSPEMDPTEPIVTVSLGAARDIQFRRVDRTGETETLRLGHGSAAIMAPGMQQEWQHRIPKAGFACGPRISLTFRGYVNLDGDGGRLLDERSPDGRTHQSPRDGHHHRGHHPRDGGLHVGRQPRQPQGPAASRRPLQAGDGARTLDEDGRPDPIRR